MRQIAAALMSVLVLASCANNDLAEQGNRSRAGKSKNAAEEKKNKGQKKGKALVGKGPKGKAEKIAEDVEAADPESGSAVAQAPQDFGGDAPSSGIDPSLARASASVDDPSSDARKQGITPPYTEVTGASVQGMGKTVRFTLTFAADVPNNVPKDQYLVVAFGVTGRKEGEGFAVGATCDEKGWHPYAGAKGESEKFPGRFEVNGNQVVMEVPWSHVRGPRAFEWYASTGWYGKVANQTHWSFDAVPNEKAGKFPG